MPLNTLKKRVLWYVHYISILKRLSQPEKFYIMSNSNYITFWKRQNWGDNKKIRSWAREETNRQRTEDFHGNENTLFCSVAKSCLTLCDPMDCSPLGSSVHGILQARILEWVAMFSSRVSSQPRDKTRISCVSCISRWVLYQSHLGRP